MFVYSSCGDYHPATLVPDQHHLKARSGRPGPDLPDHCLVYTQREITGFMTIPFLCLPLLKAEVKAKAEGNHAHAPVVFKGIVSFAGSRRAEAELIEADILRAEYLCIVAIG
jgi:hypothetical protein